MSNPSLVGWALLAAVGASLASAAYAWLALARLFSRLPSTDQRRHRQDAGETVPL